MKKQPRVLILSKGSRENPASRYRHYNMLPYLERAGFKVDIFPLFEDVYYKSILLEKDAKKRILRKSLYSMKRFIKRISHIPFLGHYDLVVIENQLFPYEQGFLEWIATRINGKLVIEFDDAIFLTKLHSGKLARTLKLAEHVIVGNPNLAEFARRYNDSVSVIPTVFDLRHYDKLPEREPKARPAIGWLGQPVGLQYLKVVAPALQELAKTHDFELRILSRESVEIPGVDVHLVPWNLEHEKQDLVQLDVGIMPLFDDIWSRHKCAGKLLHYMALGIASLASPVGVNTDIIKDGVNGFLAADTKQWTDKLARLLDDETLRLKMGKAGRLTAKEYSLQVWAPKVAELYRHLIEK